MTGEPIPGETMEETERAGPPEGGKKGVAPIRVFRKGEPGGSTGGRNRRVYGILTSWILAALSLTAVGGCGLLFGEPVRVDHPARDFQVRVRNLRGKTFGRVESARKGKGPYDVRVIMRPGWTLLKPGIKEADAVVLARTWVAVIQPAGPERARVEFVDSQGRVLAWGVYQSGNGLFVGLGGGESRPR